MDESNGVLRGECRRFARHLLGIEADEALIAHYLRFHGEQRRRLHASSFDQILLFCSRLGPPGLHLAEAYAARFARRSLLRSKLVLVLALLETSKASFAIVDRPGASGPAGAITAALALAVREALFLLPALLLLGPLHLILRAPGRKP